MSDLIQIKNNTETLLDSYKVFARAQLSTSRCADITGYDNEPGLTCKGAHWNDRTLQRSTNNTTIFRRT